jgi:hypothetical protein
MIEYTVKVYPNGNKFWYLNDKRHREDGPAIEYANGTKCWYLNGKYHRVDGPAIEWADGDKFWYLNDKLHRVDGPAIEWADGDKFWYLNDKLHREDGPAVEYANGNKFWYLNGVELTEEKFNRRMNPKFKIGDKVTAPAYLGEWTNCTVIDINFCDEWPIQCVRPDGMTGVFRENELEFMPEPKELTVKEISELLGYEIKVVEG